MVVYKSGDIFDSETSIICHQVNCAGVITKGISKRIKNKYPRACRIYFDTVDFEQRKLGTTIGLLGKCIIGEDRGKMVAHLFGQYEYVKNKQNTSIDALTRAFKFLRSVCETYGYSISIPYNIGCGITGASWSREIEPLIHEIFDSSTCPVEIWIP